MGQRAAAQHFHGVHQTDDSQGGCALLVHVSVCSCQVQLCMMLPEVATTTCSVPSCDLRASNLAVEGMQRDCH